MAKLIFFTPMSLDGYISASDYDWSAPDEEAHAFINEIMRPFGTYLIGRKNYETMSVWETPEVIPDATPVVFEFAQIWQAADKIVYSKTLESVSTPRTHLKREFEPQAIMKLKAQLPHDISISGPTLAANAIEAGLVDEYQFLVGPAALGSGIRVLPSNVRLNLELLEDRRFANGLLFLRYQPRA